MILHLSCVPAIHLGVLLYVSLSLRSFYWCIITLALFLNVNLSSVKFYWNFVQNLSCSFFWVYFSVPCGNLFSHQYPSIMVFTTVTVWWEFGRHFIRPTYQPERGVLAMSDGNIVIRNKHGIALHFDFWSFSFVFHLWSFQIVLQFSSIRTLYLFNLCQGINIL